MVRCGGSAFAECCDFSRLGTFLHKPIEVEVWHLYHAFRWLYFKQLLRGFAQLYSRTLYKKKTCYNQII